MLHIYVSSRTINYDHNMRQESILLQKISSLPYWLSTDSSALISYSSPLSYPTSKVTLAALFPRKCWLVKY